MKNKKFDHSQLIETLSNIDINNHHSIRIILENLNNGEELIGTPFDKKDTFHLDPITNDIGMQFKMLDRNLEYEKIFEANDEKGNKKLEKTKTATKTIFINIRINTT